MIGRLNNSIQKVKELVFFPTMGEFSIDETPTGRVVFVIIILIIIVVPHTPIKLCLKWIMWLLISLMFLARRRPRSSLLPEGT